MDDDDEWIDENKIEKQINIFENSNDDKLGIVCSSVRIYSSKSAYEEKIIQKPINLITTILKGNSYIYNSTVITKRDIMICVGGFDVNLPRGVDSDFYRRCIINLGCSAHFMQEVTTGVHEYGEDRMTPTDSSFVNKDLRVHSLSNLFIVSGSVFPTSGSANPTWTIASLAMMFAEKFKID